MFYYYPSNMAGSEISLNTLLLFALLGVMVLGLIAQSRVNSTFRKYSQQPSSRNVPAFEAARDFLAQNNSSCQVTQVRGNLTDHYNPRTNTVGLSESVYASSSVAALAVAAHEIGHVLQYEEGYGLIKLRNFLLPAAQLGSTAAPAIVIIGLLMGSTVLSQIGVILFGAVLLFQLATLPVEFNASSRGIRLLESNGYVSYGESDGAKSVLRAAAMTYVVATLSTLITFMRLLLIARGSRRR